MAVTKTWSITDLTRETSDGYGCWVKWKLTGTEGDKTVESTGKTKLERPSSALEAYDSLTEEKVIGWVKAKINAESPAAIDQESGKTAVERMEAIMDKKMGWLNAPATANGLKIFGSKADTTIKWKSQFLMLLLNPNCCAV